MLHGVHKLSNGELSCHVKILLQEQQLNPDIAWRNFKVK
jgi:hypothetical protein